MPEILFIRHAESESNLGGIWNGRTESALTPRGEETLERLSSRFAGARFDAVVTSPLQRAVETARSISSECQVEDDLIEMDLGQWEGRTYQEVVEEHGDLLEAAIAGDDVRMGLTGETISEVTERARAAIGRLAARLGPRGRAVVVTHGGVMQGLLEPYLKGRGRRAHAFVANTAISRLTWTGDRPRLAGFNDLGHLGPRSSLVEEQLAAGNPVLALIRHGQTRANLERRWQGQEDWGLDEKGHTQAAAFRDWYGTFPSVYASPLGRAMGTARYLATEEVVPVEGLMELYMGRWEGFTSPELDEQWPDLMRSIYHDGMDLRRGETGESWGEMTHRFAAAVHALEPAAHGPTVVVAHGGAIRAYVSSLTSTMDSHAESLYTPGNTSVTHVAMTEGGPMLLDYAVATHLEGLS